MKITLEEELSHELEECKRHNLNEFCGTCVRSPMCCDQCSYELYMKEPTLHLTDRELREILSYQDSVDLVGGYLND